jgi:hypothetical protein
VNKSEVFTTFHGAFKSVPHNAFHSEAGIQGSFCSNLSCGSYADRSTIATVETLRALTHNNEVDGRVTN